MKIYEETRPQWKDTLERLDSPESEKKHLRELLTYAIVEKFSKLTREEIEKMLKLTPLDETVAEKELIQIGKSQGLEEGLQKGLEKGMEKGKVIGQIQMAQKLLKQEVTPQKELKIKTMAVALQINGEYCTLILRFLLHFVSAINK